MHGWHVKFGAVLLACLWGFSSLPVNAACPAVPVGFTLPPPERLQVDLVRELKATWQAGGEITLICAPDGSPRVGRLMQSPHVPQLQNKPAVPNISR